MPHYSALIVSITIIFSKESFIEKKKAAAQNSNHSFITTPNDIRMWSL